jgi:hypothetical protein
MWIVPKSNCGNGSIRPESEGLQTGIVAAFSRFVGSADRKVSLKTALLGKPAVALQALVLPKRICCADWFAC